MASEATSTGDGGNGQPALARQAVAALQHMSWRSQRRLSSAGGALERFLESAGFDRAPWLAVGYAIGIALWFALANRWQWLALVAGCLGGAAALAAGLRRSGRYPYIRQAGVAMALMIGAGCLTVWAKSAAVGTPPITHPMAPVLTARVLERFEQPAEARVRLVLATREPRSNRLLRLRLTVPIAEDQPGLVEGAVVRLRARLMPPGAPSLPGSYNFARAAWFEGIAGSGSALGPIAVVAPPPPGGHWIARIRHAIAAHIRARIPGSPGGIAADYASGDRGGISAADDQVMRDSGLTHLLAIGGLHVSAVIGVTYVVVLRLLALIPWLALRWRLPAVAALSAAGAGAFYTALTGAHVGTVRSCMGAVLALAAVALGRQPLSLRLLATVAVTELLLWPEALVGPSFQMSFGSVIAIISLHNARPVHDFLSPRGESWWLRVARHLAIILLTGMVIDLALMPIALFHFHRAGIYGSMANVVGIPLTTFVSMPLIGIALVLDAVGAGGPAWWLTGKSLELLLWIAHFTASRPGAITRLPAMGASSFILFVAGMLWLALWQGRARLWGLIPALAATASLATLTPPDVLITGDGRNLGILSDNGAKLMVLRGGRGRFSRDMMLEVMGMSGDTAPLDQWPGVRCNHDFCLIELARGNRIWRLLVARDKAVIGGPGLERACAGVDMVIAQQKLFGACHPALLRADRATLLRTGGIALYLRERRVTTVADSEGEHPWWRAPHRLPSEAEDNTPGETGLPPGASRAASNPAAPAAASPQ